METVSFGRRRIGARDLRRGESGSVAVWTLMLALLTITMLALVVDVGNALATRVDAARTAEQAARLASDQITLESARTGGSEIDPIQADSAVQQYLSGTGMVGDVTVHDQSVTVTITARVDTAFGSAVGIDELEVRADADAQSIDTNDTPDTL